MLKVIQIHDVSLILLFILWYAEVILRAPSHLHKYVNELLVYHFQEKFKNDDQSLSPVTPLVSSLFLSFLIP